MVKQRGQVDAPIVRPQPADGAGLLAQLALGHGHHRHLRDGGVSQKGSLHLGGVDVKAAANDLVLDAADDADKALFVPDDLVAGQIEAVGRHPLLPCPHALCIAQKERGAAHACLSPTAARQWAQLNPEAFSRDPLSVQDVLKSKMVSDPLTVRDCCLVTDGGGAYVLVRADRAKQYKKKAAYMLGVGAAHWHRQIAAMPDLTVTAATESGQRAYEMAGLKPADVDVLELYDAFTINTLLFLEDLGFCKKGEGGAFLSGGRIAPGGSLPVNTNGGGLSCVHPGMYGMFLIVEAGRQLRGEAGARQVKDPKVALTHGNGGVLSSQITALFGTEDTL